MARAARTGPAPRGRGTRPTAVARTFPGMSTPVRARRRPLLPSLLAGAGLVAVVAVIGWMLLLFVKGTVVLVSYALGIALVVVPLLLAHRLVAGHTGSERWQRIGTIGQAVAIGVALCVIAHLVGQHGWLLIAVPAAVVAVTRLVHAVSARRHLAAR
jgi:hypothetical protein